MYRFLVPSNASPRHVPTPNLRSTCSWWSYEARCRAGFIVTVSNIYQVPSNLRETEQQKMQNSLWSLIVIDHRIYSYIIEYNRYISCSEGKYPIHALYGIVIWEVVTHLIFVGMLPLQVRVESEGDAPMGIPATKKNVMPSWWSLLITRWGEHPKM